MPADVPHLPEQAPIDAYGNGGFRFADMSHRGSLLIVPSGMYRWDAGDVETLTNGSFDQVWREAEGIGFLLLGTGDHQIRPARDVETAFAERQIGLEVMQTGAAVRTYNVLLAEKRPVAAALFAVDHHRPAA